MKQSKIGVGLQVSDLHTHVLNLSKKTNECAPSTEYDIDQMSKEMLEAIEKKLKAGAI
jgi:hypothetical protein